MLLDNTVNQYSYFQNTPPSTDTQNRPPSVMAYRETDKTRARRESIRQRILAAAHVLVVEGGFGYASMTAVAARAGIATGSLYKHFPSKSDLFSEVFRHATQKEVDKVAMAIQGSDHAVLRLQRAVQTFARRALKSRGLAWALIAEPVDPKVDEDRLHYRQAYAKLFETLIHDGMLRGELPQQSASVTSAALVGSLAEALVGPLAPGQRQWLETNTGAECIARQQTDDALVDALLRFCLQAVTGTPYPREAPL